MKTKLDWSEGTPSTEDIYLVAIDLGPDAGYFDMCYWNGERWGYEYPEKIIGFVSFNNLKKQLNFEWPRPEQTERPKPIAKDYGTNPWVEE